MLFACLGGVFFLSRFFSSLFFPFLVQQCFPLLPQYPFPLIAIHDIMFTCSGGLYLGLLSAIGLSFPLAFFFLFFSHVFSYIFCSFSLCFSLLFGDFVR
ncbi:hypothetical protein DFH27DRAFT_388521 [Peziza echinospora]|nr:hypothetical protein DFH27DRAFT_388521 [Peziza echinospora]